MRSHGLHPRLAALSSALFFVSETLPRLASKRYAQLGPEAEPPSRQSLEMGPLTPRFGAKEPFGACAHSRVGPQV